MSEDLERLAAAEAARIRSRDRKLRGPKVLVDNAGLRKVTMDLAQRRRRRTAGDPPPDRRITGEGAG